MLQVDNLIVQFGAATVIKGVSLKMNLEEFVSIIGANGAGKTSLLRAISRLVPIASGTISFDGKRIDSIKPEEVVRRGIIHVPEGRKLVGTASVLDNLKLGGYLSWGEVRNRLSLIFEMFPVLEKRKNQQARTMSGGEQQMLAIGRALMAKPQLLMLDEVTFGLAPMMVSLIRSKLTELHRLKIGILLTEQNAELALTLSERCYVMEYGSISKQGRASELRDDDQVKAAYLGL